MSFPLYPITISAITCNSIKTTINCSFTVNQIHHNHSLQFTEPVLCPCFNSLRNHHHFKAAPPHGARPQSPIQFKPPQKHKLVTNPNHNRTFITVKSSNLQIQSQEVHELTH
jgi:hypothetical protein